jgi:transposase
MVTQKLSIDSSERKELARRARSQARRHDEVRRARLILMLANGTTYETIQQRLRCSPSYISLWRQRFLRQRVAGLEARYKGSAATVMTPEVEAWVLNKTRQKPSDGSTHWSTRKLARELRVNHTLIARVWKRAGIKPHRLERYMASNDVNFEAKAADIIGLYINPPQHAAVFCVDEKSALQALDRTLPVLPLSPGRLERHGFEYHRHGTLSLLAGLNTRTGEVLGQAVPRHTSDKFVAFLEQIVAAQPAGQEIHIIADNLSTHKTKRVEEFLQRHPQVHLHYTPTYSSWLNQIELWFAKIQRDLIARGIFKSVKDLERKIMRFIKHYNAHAQPFKWAYKDPSRRIILLPD